MLSTVRRKNTHLFTWLQEPHGFWLHETSSSCYTMLALLILMHMKCS